MTDTTADTSILQAEKFNSFRPILGRVAHDFNNLLTPLTAYPSLLSTYLEEDSKGQELITAIEKASNDMIHINEQLMLLASRGVPTDLEMSLTELIESVIQQLASAVDLSDTVIRKDIAANLPPVKVSETHLSKALYNILMNACESHPDKVVITIAVKPISIPREVLEKSDAPYAPEHIRISVTDNGPGIPEDILPKAAVPFVTTKKAQKRRGSGLGLSIAQVVCRDHGGFLSIETPASGGTCTSIHLPVIASHPDTDEPTEADTDEIIEKPEKKRNKKRILVVDDEQTIRKLFRMIISSALPECEVETASNGKEALDLFEKHHHGVLVMDLHMPVMDGQTAFHELIKLSSSRDWEPPSVIFCTGFAPPETVNDIVAVNSGHCLLSKPVRSEILLEAIKTRLS